MTAYGRIMLKVDKAYEQGRYETFLPFRFQWARHPTIRRRVVAVARSHERGSGCLAFVNPFRQLIYRVKIYMPFV